MNIDVEWLTDLWYLIVAEVSVPDNWKCTELLVVFWDKGHPVEFGCYWAVGFGDSAKLIIRLPVYQYHNVLEWHYSESFDIVAMCCQ